MPNRLFLITFREFQKCCEIDNAQKIDERELKVHNVFLTNAEKLIDFSKLYLLCL
jgi:hypothetical protein